MIEKISKSVFFITLFLLFIISTANENFTHFLIKISFNAEYEIFGIKICISLFYIPFIVGILENSFKIHDKISKLLGIRKRFDKNVIIHELFRLLEIKTDEKQIKEKTVSSIMSFAFYEYASSTNPKIDEHQIHLALGGWCWYWIALDTFVSMFITGVLFLIFSWSCYNFLIWVIILFLLSVYMFFIWLQVKKYSRDEVLSILRYLEDIGKDKDMVNNKAKIIERIENALQNR